MRKYALVILDNKDEIKDRFNLDIVTQPTGNGFELDLSTISSDLEDIITKVVQKKNKITFVVQQIHDSYSKANILANWIQKYSQKDSSMVLEYTDGAGVVKYCEGKVTRLDKNEQTYNNVLQQTLEFTQTTPFFIARKNTISIQVSSTGKKYPYKYPYQYGRNQVTNNKIDNPYILDIPLIITIKGAINNPIVSLLDKNGYPYYTIKINDLIAENDIVVINSAQRKIVKIYADGTEEDLVPKVDPEYDMFLRAKGGESSITINTQGTEEGFGLIGSWRQYTL